MVLSSRIEGTRASLSDVLEAEAAEREGNADLREVRNYVEAIDHGLARLGTLPLSLRLVGELHEKLMRGVRGDETTPGEFRRSQNWIGPQGSTPLTAPYVPPPVAELMSALGEWETFLHQRDPLPDLIQCALMHEQFEAIHPFLDGNGRVGRLLIKSFGDFCHWFAKVYEIDRLDFKLRGVSLSGHHFHGFLFPYPVVQNLSSPKLTFYLAVLSALQSNLHLKRF